MPVMDTTTDPDDRAHAEMFAFLHAAADREASDVHLVPGYPLTYRVHGRLERAEERLMEPDQVRRLVESIMPPSPPSQGQKQ